jgi:hypothetical protein
LYNYFQKDVRGTALLPFFLHQLTIDYFMQLNMSTIGNGTAGASGTGPALGYNLTLSRLFIVFVLFLYGLNVNTNNIYDAIILLMLNNTNNIYVAIILLILNNNMIYLMDFGIKIYRKMPKILTYFGR